jgi:hypothetical protein
MSVVVDWRTAIIALLISPLVLRVMRMVAGFLIKWTGKAVDAVLWIVSHRLQSSFSAAVNLKRYCKIELERPENKYLLVPWQGCYITGDRQDLRSSDAGERPRCKYLGPQ